jgi:two-component system NtrC family sensor kinase
MSGPQTTPVAMGRLAIGGAQWQNHPMPPPCHTPAPCLLLLVSPDATRRAMLMNELASLCPSGLRVRGCAGGDEAALAAREARDQGACVPILLWDADPAGSAALRDAPELAHTHRVLLAPAGSAPPESGAFQAVLPSTSPAPDLLRTVRRGLTEYFLRHAPERVDMLAAAMDIDTLAAAYINSEVGRRALHASLDRLQRSFFSRADASDEELDQDLIRQIDLALQHPPRESFAAGELLLKQDESEGTLWIVESGRVNLCRVIDGREVVFHSQTTGRVIGAMSVTRRSRSFFNARADQPVTAIRLTYADLERALQCSPEFASCFISALTRAMARRNRRSVQLQTEVLSLNKVLAAERDQLASTLDQLQAAQTLLVQSGKMATLGELSAGVAHELNNPVASILRSTEYVREDLRALLPGLPGGAALARMLDLSLARAPLSTRDERALRETLAGDLGDEALARRLVQAGITRAADYRDLLEGLPQGAEEERARSLDLVGSLGQSVRNLKSCGERIAALVSSLRAYSRPDNSPSDLVDVREGLDDTLRLLNHKLREIEVERHFNEVPAIPGFPGELNQVWTNLISNAAQAMGGHGWLGVSTDPLPGGGVAVSIADNGPGIAPEHQERIFEARFTTRKGRVEFGLGLGLPICKNIVARHGGSITVESRPGRTVFTVTLPASPEPPPASERQP